MSQALEFSFGLDKQLSRWLGAIPVLIPLFQRLNVISIINRYCPCAANVDEGTVALILALNRLMAPRPLYKVADWMAQTVLEDTLGVPAEKLHDRRIGDLLEALHPHLDSIWKELVHQAMACYGISLSFIHYDITSIYFEGAYEEAEKLEYGYSRDNQSDCKQVNLQLNITGEEGIPLAFEVINGSTSDRTTPIENMHALREVLEGMPIGEDIILVSDQAMLDRDVILQYHQQGIGYLGPLPALKEYEEVLMACSRTELQEHPLSYRPKRQKAGEPPIYYGVLVPVSISGNKIEGTVAAQGLLVYSTRKAQLDADKRTSLLDRYLARLDTIKRHLNTRKYKNAAYTWEQIHKAQSNYATVKELVAVHLEGEDGQLVLRFDIRTEPMALAQERDGRYLLVTNRPLSAEEMMEHFKAQDQIEKRNQTLKGPLRIRPIFLHKQERIESLIFLCMVALLAFSILEMLAKRAHIPMTAERILDHFQTLAVVYTRFKDGSCWKQLVPLSAFQNKFIQALELPPPEIYLKHINLQ